MSDLLTRDEYAALAKDIDFEGIAKVQLGQMADMDLAGRKLVETFKVEPIDG